jgi:aminoglycoside 2''-phosphotransferase
MDIRLFYIRQIKKYYPDLQIETALLNQEGQYNDVLVVNKDLIFRFAKVPAAVETLRKEIIIQQSLQDHVSLTIPNPIYCSVETEVVGEAFVGYRMIPGKPLWFDNFKAISDSSALERMAVQLAGFLFELHHVPVDKIIPIELPFGDTREKWVNMYHRIRAKLFAYMRPNARQRVAKQFEVFLDNPDRYKFKPVLRHGDFGTGNIIYDPDRLSVVGIIDFGGTGSGDPATDFAGLYSSYGEGFYRQCYSVYPEMEEAWERVQFYCGTFALQEALFGLENGNQEAFQSGIAEYT